MFCIYKTPVIFYIQTICFSLIINALFPLMGLFIFSNSQNSKIQIWWEYHICTSIWKHTTVQKYRISLMVIWTYNLKLVICWSFGKEKGNRKKREGDAQQSWAKPSIRPQPNPQPARSPFPLSGERGPPVSRVMPALTRASIDVRTRSR